MNSDDLRFVLALHDEGTLVRAAGKLRVSHTTVARRIAALEAELGSTLFTKAAAGQVLTAAGEAVRDVARRVHEELTSLERDVVGRDARLSGTLRVTTIDALVLHNTRELSSFGERYPDVELDVVVDNRMRSLTRREADVAVRFTNAPAEHLVGRKIGRLEFALYGARELIEGQADPADVATYPWLSWSESERTGMAEHFFRQHADAGRPAMRVDSSISLWAAARAGVGVALLGCLWADRTPGLQRIGGLWPDAGLDLWILTHPDLRRTSRVHAFIEHFGDAMRCHQDTMSGAHPLVPPIENVAPLPTGNGA
ncbi:MAG: LysR family transcriptional regulator [Myxococcota bacterium]